MVGAVAWRGGLAAVFFLPLDSHAQPNSMRPISGIDSKSLGLSIYLLQRYRSTQAGTPPRSHWRPRPACTRVLAKMLQLKLYRRFPAGSISGTLEANVPSH